MHDLQDLQLDLIQVSKMVKNQSLVKNFISAYEERFIVFTTVNKQKCFVVLQKKMPGKEVKKVISNVAYNLYNSTKGVLEK